jgi:hypothetical protein
MVVLATPLAVAYLMGAFNMNVTINIAQAADGLVTTDTSCSEISCDFLAQGEKHRDDYEFPLGRSVDHQGNGLQVFHFPGLWLGITKAAGIAPDAELITGEETEEQALAIVEWFRRQRAAHQASLKELAGLWSAPQMVEAAE